MAEVDISKYHFRHESGFLVAIGSWAKHGPGDWRRCLVIMRRWSFGSGDMRLFTVFDDIDLPNWALDSPGYGDAAWAMTMALRGCEELDITADKANAIRIIALVNEHLYELLMMPPRPPMDTVAIADVVIRERETGRTIEKEVRAESDV